MKKCLIVLIGESFRLGGQGTRNRGSKESFPGQMEACDSHLNFFRHLKEKFNIESHVLINTYKTKYDADLMNKYLDNELEGELFFNSNDEPLGLQNLFNQSCDLILKKVFISDFDFIYFIRIDLVLKKNFLKSFYPNNEKVTWPFVCFAYFHEKLVPFYQYAHTPRVSDLMVYIPKKFFYLVENKKINFGHDGWFHLKNQGIDQNLIINTLHDADSAKDWNPLYRISGRPESDVWWSLNFYIDENYQVLRKLDGQWIVHDKFKI